MNTSLAKTQPASHSTSSGPAALTEIVADPRWEDVRNTAKQITATGRMYLRGQVRLGMLLAALRKELNIGRGKAKAKTPDSGVLTWAELVKQETGYSRQACDVFIDLYDATVAKLKKAKKGTLGEVVAKKTALVLFTTGALTTLTDEQWAIVDTTIASLTDGETQASLMVELGVLPKPKDMPKGGGAGKKDKLAPEQLAFAFFASPFTAICQTRTSTDYKKLLRILPATSDDPTKPSLVLMRDEMAAMVEDINEALAGHTKQAKGKVLK